ncbi:MAG: sensor histidine kinase [Armatimonadetes bacterium]|nr:sensor histidine kinase [Armatimonadota bacterium]
MLTPKQREMWRVNKYIWLSLAFVFVWLWARHEQFDPTAQTCLAWTLAAGCANLGLRSWIAFRSPAGTTGQWGWAFSIADIALIAVAVRYTGGIRSDLWLLYILLSVTETLSVSVKDELLLLALTFAGYTVSVWPIADDSAFLTRLFFLFVISAIARRLYLNAEERSRQLAVLREQLGVAEEKSRVARELHDGLGREIVNVILGLEVARRAADRKPEQVPALLEENLALLRVAMNDTRDLIFQTRPWTLEGDGGAAFAERLERYARQFADRTGLAVEVQCDMGDAALSPQTAFGLLRIVQEALNNVAKHAQATEVTIRVYRDGMVLAATVADNGVGFSKLQTLVKSGIGLPSMRERAQDLGGTLDVASQPGQGTTVILRMPSV